MLMTEPETIAVSNLGPCELQSPLPRDTRSAVEDRFVTDTRLFACRSKLTLLRTAAGSSSKKPARGKKSSSNLQRPRQPSLPAEDLVRA
jgi:hypothetical protein